MAQHTIIEVQQVAKNFQGNGNNIEVLSNISLTVKSPEILTILGPSGCGKTTFLNVLAGFIQPNTGKVLLNGENKFKNNIRIPMIFQSDSLFGWYNVEENIKYGLQPQNNISEILKLFHLTHKKNAFPKELSGGMKKRVELARVFVLNPKIILADEPFSWLDYQIKESMQDLMLQLWEKNKNIIIFSTHDIEEAIYLSDRIAIFSNCPTEIKKIISVPFLRPRKKDIKFLAEFQDLRKEIEKLIEKPQNE